MNDDHIVEMHSTSAEGVADMITLVCINECIIYVVYMQICVVLGRSLFSISSIVDSFIINLDVWTH